MKIGVFDMLVLAIILAIILWKNEALIGWLRGPLPLGSSNVPDQPADRDSGPTETDAGSTEIDAGSTKTDGDSTNLGTR